MDKGHASVLTIHSMTRPAVMRKGILAIGTILRRIRQRIFLFGMTDKEMMLGVIDSLGFELAGRHGFAARQHAHQSNQDQIDKPAHC